jgi:ATP-dependent helicase/nuclease subunit A
VREFAAPGTARAVGIAAHLLLERWDGRDDATLLEEVPRVSRAAAVEADVGPEAVEREVREIFRGFLASELRERLREVEVLGREVPIVQREGKGPAYRGTLDLLYRDGGGEVVVADYKTDRETDPARLAETYGPQLSVYARAVQRALGLARPPRTELWLLRTATVHSL